MALEPAQIIVDANNMTTIVNNLNNIYTNVITYTIGLMAVVGALVPALISYYQNRQFKTEQHSIKNDIKAELEKNKKELKEQFDRTISEELEKQKIQNQLDMQEMQTKINKEIFKLKGAAFHLQANQNNSPEFTRRPPILSSN